MLNNLQDYLANRAVDFSDRDKVKDITENDQQLSDVAGTWKTSKEAIRLVVRARCEKLREKLIFRDLPYETVVSRQCLVEVVGILEDFERITAEFETREKGKGGTKVTETKAKGK